MPVDTMPEHVVKHLKQAGYNAGKACAKGPLWARANNFDHFLLAIASFIDDGITGSVDPLDEDFAPELKQGWGEYIKATVTRYGQLKTTAGRYGRVSTSHEPDKHQSPRDHALVREIAAELYAEWTKP